MYSISEITQKIGVSRSTLLYYERLGIITPKRQPQNGYRRYSDQDLTRLIVLRQLQKAGFSLEECQQALNGNIDSTLIEQHLIRLKQELQQMELTQQRLQGSINTRLANGSITATANKSCSSGMLTLSNFPPMPTPNGCVKWALAKKKSSTYDGYHET